VQLTPQDSSQVIWVQPTPHDLVSQVLLTVVLLSLTEDELVVGGGGTYGTNGIFVSVELVVKLVEGVAQPSFALESARLTPYDDAAVGSGVGSD
jgi:hypothetical protein